MKYLGIILAFLVLLSFLHATERFVARITNPTPEMLQQFERQDYDICGYHPDQYLDLLLDNTSFANLKTEFPTLTITQTEAAMKANLLSCSKDIPGYRNYQSLVTELMQLQAQYPSLIQVVSLGETTATEYNNQGIAAYQDYDHQIWAVKLSNNVSIQEDEPAFYFVGEHHAREPISTETVMGILNNFLENYGSDPFVTDMVNTSEIWFVPLLNPDGHKIVLDQTDVWWRKNLRDNNNNHVIDLGSSGDGPDGTDLNRNYGYKWGYLNASSDPSSITYHGTEPFSEVETQIFKTFLESHNFVAGISYHSYGEYVLYPFGYMYDIISPDAAELQALANSMASTIPSSTGSGNYTPMPSYNLYPVSGSLDDWAYGTRGIFAYTIELATTFIPTATLVPAIVQNNLAAARLLLSRKNSKSLKGHISNAITGEPLAAMIFVVGIDDDRLKTSQICSEPQFGSFQRFLPAGQHLVKYICPGFQTEAMTVQINDTMPTVTDIALLPVEPVNLTVKVIGYDGTPLSAATLTLIDLPDQSYTTDEAGMLSIVDFYPGVYRYTITHSGSEQLLRMENILGPNLTITLSSVPDLLEDFETDLGNWSVTGNWGRSTTHQNGSYSLSDSPTGNYSGNVNSSCRLIQPINLVGVMNANLQFYAKYNIALDGDFCQLSYSLNGTTWYYFTHFNGVADWQLYTFNLNHLLGHQVYFRFRLSSNNYGNSDGIYIDDFKVFTTSNPTPVQDELLSPPAVTLGCYPNPFSHNLSINIESSTKSKEPAKLAIYNLKGQLVKRLYTDFLQAGKNVVVWDGTDGSAQACANGVYFARLIQTGRPAQTLKTILIK